jgi:hypothetical protein
MTDKKKTGGLAGVSAGETQLCTVGKEGAGLTYRGYDIYDLADRASFEEVAYLLLYGKLPNSRELAAYIKTLKSLRGLPAQLKQVLEVIPGNAHPMDVLRSAVSLLGNFEPEGEFSNQGRVADRLLACLPSMLLYWHRFHTDGKRIDVETGDDSVSGHFLHLLHDRKPSELHRKSLDTTLILTRTRIQCIDIRRARHNRNAFGYALGRDRRDRRIARAIARRRQRSGNGVDSEIQIPGRGSKGRTWNAGAERKDHGFRPSRVYGFRSAQFGEQIVEMLSEEGRHASVCRGSNRA